MIPAILLYVLAGAGLLWVGHRAVRPLTSWMAAALLLLPLVVTGQALLRNRVFGPVELAYQAIPLRALGAERGIVTHNPALSDVYCLVTPWAKALDWSLRQGEWPLWNPFILTGDPLAASSQVAAYHPVTWIALLTELPYRAGVLASLWLLLAALSMFLFLRELGCRETAAMLGAAGWAFCDHSVFWVLWPLTAAVGVLPVVLLAVRRLVSMPGRGSLRAAVVLAIALALSLLAGHPESTAHVVLLGALYGVWQIARARPRAVVRPVAGALLAGVLALGLSAIHLLPLLDAVEQSIEHEHRRQHYAYADRSAPWSELGSRLLPSFVSFAYGKPGRPQSLRPPGLDPVVGYAGSLLLPLVAFGLWSSRHRERWILAALGLLGLLAAASAPLVGDLLASLPIYSIAINERLGFAGAFAVAALAGLGAEAWMAAPDRRRLARWSALTVLGLGVAVLLQAPTLLPAGLAAADFFLYTAALLVPPALVWALARAWRPAATAGAFLLIVLIGQRALEIGSVYGTREVGDFFPTPPVLAKLPVTEAEPFRVIGLSYALLPNTATMWELEDPRGYQAIHHRRLIATTPLWSKPMPVSFNVVPRLDEPFLAFLNVRYAVTGPAAGRTEGWVRRYRGDDGALFENLGALPRAFVPERVRLGASHAVTLAEMEIETDFRRRAWIETPETADGAGVRGRSNGPGSVRTERQGSGYLVHADMQRRGWVVLSVTHWRGWHAVLDDGEELPLAYGNHAFLAFEVPRGQHRVRLFYRPASFVWGRALSLATLALLIVAGGVVVLRARARAGALTAAAAAP